MHSEDVNEDAQPAEDAQAMGPMSFEHLEREAIEKAKAQLEEERLEKNKVRSAKRREKYGGYLSTQHSPKILEAFKAKCHRRGLSMKEVVELLVKAYCRGDIELTTKKVELATKKKHT